MVKVVILTILLLTSVSANDAMTYWAIQEASFKTGVKYETLAKIAYIESRYDSKAKNPRSTARGLFQIIKGTQKQLEETYDLHGDIYDPFHNAILAAYNIKAAKSYYKEKGQKITQVDLYLAHFVGFYGSYKMKTYKQSLNACKTFPRACKSNKELFSNRTIKEFRNHIQDKLDNAKVI